MAKYALLIAASASLNNLVWMASAASPSSKVLDFTSTQRTFTGFKTEPTIVAEDFHIQRLPVDRHRLASGYIFIDALVKAPGYGYGLSIYTVEGELIWRGHQDRRAQNFHVCDYLGEKGTHICYYTRYLKHRIPNLPEGKQLGSPKSTFGRLEILDSSYNKVKAIEHGFDRLPVNGHAFETHDDGYSATTIVARPRAVDLRKHGGPKQGWILNQCIQDFHLPSGDDAFHWCYYEAGLSVWASKHIFFIGDAQINHAWDFLHANAIDKNKYGDYIISFRHADVLIKVAGKRNPDGAKPGEVLWRLGGKSNDFKMIGFDTPQGFTRQHDVRFLEAHGTKEIISVFNNAWDWYTPPSQNWSEGQIISVDSKTMKATRTHVYPHPHRAQGRARSLSEGRGSVQSLPNKNVIIGWGAIPEITEFSSNGSVLYHAKFVRSVATKGREFSYRVSKALWIGKPPWDPKLVAYSPNCQPKAPLTAYVSHNGATEIYSWRFSGAVNPNSTWKPLSTHVKVGFETQARLNKTLDFLPFVKAEALDANDLVLGSAIAEVFVPAKKYRPSCGRESCNRNFHYERRKSMARLCYNSLEIFSSSVPSVSPFRTSSSILTHPPTSSDSNASLLPSSPTNPSWTTISTAISSSSLSLNPTPSISRSLVSKPTQPTTASAMDNIIPVNSSVVSRALLSFAALALFFTSNEAVTAIVQLLLFHSFASNG